MARIRRLQISNFRSIQALDWVPAPGINCLIGPGDSGKSSILDAIDLCVGARRGGTEPGAASVCRSTARGRYRFSPFAAATAAYQAALSLGMRRSVG